MPRCQTSVSGPERASNLSRLGALTSFERLALGGWTVMALEAAFHVDGQHLCPFRLLTGLRCPGCGMGHAVVAAFQGRWATSWSQHPLGIPLAALWTTWVAWGAANFARGRGFSDGFPRVAEGRRAWALLALVLAVHALRVLA